MAIMNILFILQLFMLLQGFSFLFYISHVKGWVKAIPIILVVVSLLNPIMLTIVRILGIIDLSFPFREAISKTKIAIGKQMLLGAEIMPSFLKERSIRTPLYGLYAVMIVFYRCFSLLQLDYCCGWISLLLQEYFICITEKYSSTAADRGVYCNFILSIKKSRRRSFIANADWNYAY